MSCCYFNPFVIVINPLFRKDNIYIYIYNFDFPENYKIFIGVGSAGGILVLVLISVITVWACLKRRSPRQQDQGEAHEMPEVAAPEN